MCIKRNIISINNIIREMNDFIKNYLKYFTLEPWAKFTGLTRSKDSPLNYFKDKILLNISISLSHYTTVFKISNTFLK